MEKNKIFQGDAIKVLKTFPDKCIDMMMTSPPYWSLRDYQTSDVIWGGDKDCEHDWNSKDRKIHSGVTKSTPQASIDKKGGFATDWKTTDHFCSKCGAWRGQLGLEPSFELYIKHLCDIFEEVKRTLKDDGTIWINIGDTYYTKRGSSFLNDNLGGNNVEKSGLDKANNLRGRPHEYMQSKSLVGIPFRFALEMISRGWILRNTIIWHKNNVMPSCLHPETRVFIKKDNFIHHSTIKEVKKGDLILSQKGWIIVKNKWITKKDSLELEIGKVNKIICSKDHRFAISHDKRRRKINYLNADKIRSGEKGNYKDLFLYKNLKSFFNNNKLTKVDILKKNKLIWFVDIKDIKEGLKIKSPSGFAKEVKDSSLRKVKTKQNWVYVSNTHNELRRGRIRCSKVKNKSFDKIIACNSTIKENRYYELDYNLGWLIGLYVAEGGFNQERGFGGKITIHKKEEKIANKFKEIFKEKFGHKIQNEYIRNNYKSITFTSASMYVLCKELFVKGKCKTKELDINKFINSPVKFRKGFIKGYFDGDGSKCKNKLSVTSASEKLIKGVKIILSTLGELYSECKNIQKDKRTKKSYTSYLLWNNSYQKHNKRDFVYVRLKSKKSLKRKIDMVDIEVEGNTFLIEEGLISHNSTSDRYTVDFEYIFLFSKKKKYYFKQQLEPLKTKENRPFGAVRQREFGYNSKYEGIHFEKKVRQGMHRERGTNYIEKRDLPEQKDFVDELRKNFTIKELVEKGLKKTTIEHWFRYDNVGFSFPTKEEWMLVETDLFPELLKVRLELDTIKSNGGKRNKRAVWTINPKPFKEAHFATYCEELCESPIDAGCPKEVCSKCGKAVEYKKVSVGWIDNPSVKGVVCDKSRPYSVLKREGYVEVRDLPELDELKDYLQEYRKRKNLTIKQIEEELDSQAPHHWFSGESYPTKDDWIKIKELLSLDEKYDNRMTSVKYKPAEKLKSKYKEIKISCNCNAGFESGIVLDPFFGSGTTGIVALMQEKKFIGIELNPEYIKIAEKRLKPYLEQTRLGEY